MHIYGSISLNSSCDEKYFRQNFILDNSIFPPENRSVCEIMWKIKVEPDRPEMTIWRLRIECWITKAINIHSE